MVLAKWELNISQGAITLFVRTLLMCYNAIYFPFLLLKNNRRFGL